MHVAPKTPRTARRLFLGEGLLAGWYHSGFRNTAGCGDPSASRQCLLRGDVAAPRKVRRPLKRRALGTMTYQVFPAQEVVSRLDVMRVKDLEEICTALNMRKSGKKSELVGRLKTMCASSVLVHAAGGKAAVERVINSAYYRFTEEKGHAYVHRPSPGAKRTATLPGGISPKRASPSTRRRASTMVCGPERSLRIPSGPPRTSLSSRLPRVW